MEKNSCLETDTRQVIDVLEKETERLQARFNKYFGAHAICDIRLRYLSIMAICRAGLLCRSIRSMTDEEQIGDMTREFSNIRDVLDRFFDFMELQMQKGVECGHDNTRDRQILVAGR